MRLPGFTSTSGSTAAGKAKAAAAAAVKAKASSEPPPAEDEQEPSVPVKPKAKAKSGPNSAKAKAKAKAKSGSKGAKSKPASNAAVAKRTRGWARRCPESPRRKVGRKDLRRQRKKQRPSQRRLPEVEGLSQFCIYFWYFAWWGLQIQCSFQVRSAGCQLFTTTSTPTSVGSRWMARKLRRLNFEFLIWSYFLLGRHYLTK